MNNPIDFGVMSQDPHETKFENGKCRRKHCGFRHIPKPGANANYSDGKPSPAVIKNDNNDVMARDFNFDFAIGNCQNGRNYEFDSI